MSWDPYQTLGVPRSASADDIRKAYRKLAKELHPDVRPNDRQAEEKFKRATAAFNLLSEPAQRARFDRGEIDADGNERMGFGSRTHARQSAHAGGGPGGFQEAPPFDLGDIFSDLFGSGAGASGPRGFGRMRGRDIRFPLELDLLEAANGARKRVQLAEGRTLDIGIPAGVENGQVLRLKSQGGPGVQGGPPGDALVELKVKPHPFFRREGQDIHVELPISLTEAVEGARIQAPTVSGPVQLTIPPGSNTGQVLRLKGKGVAGQGDQLVKLVLSVPDVGDDELKKFVKKWAKRDAKPQRPG